MTDKATPTPSPASANIYERLISVPKDAVLKIDTPNPLGVDTRSIPVGAMCHEAADALRAEAERLAAQAAPTATGDGWFTKRPITIQAYQWFKNGDHPQDYAADTQGFENGELRVFTGAERKANGWEGSVVRYYRHPDVPGEKPCEQCGKPHHVHGWIDTLEQGHRVCPGDWIITGVKGERYPCKPDIFTATYAPAAQPSQAPVVQAVQPTQAVRMLTDDEQAAIIDMHSTGRAQGDHECAEAIQRKFCEVNGLPIPADGKIGGAA